MIRRISNRTIAIVVVVLFLLSILWNIPAAFVWGFFAQRLPAQVELSGLTGTVWSGRIQSMRIGGIEHGALDWDWNPAQTLAGRIGLDVTWLPPNGRVDAEVKLTPSSLHLEDVDGSLDAATMAALHKAPFVLGGNWLLDVALLELSNFEQVEAAEGRLVWHNAAGGLPQPMPLGHLVADLDAQDGWLTLDLADQGGPLGMRGTARWQPGQPMHIDTELRAGPDAEAALEQGIGLLGSPGSDGWVRWRARLQ